MTVDTAPRVTLPLPRSARHAAVGELVRRAHHGDTEAWSALVRQHTPLLWSITRSFRLSSADADDVVQTTWLRLTENLERVTDPEHVGAWLGTTARRECIRVTAQRRRTVPIGDDTFVLDLESPQDGPLMQLLAEDDVQAVRVALAQLPPRWRCLMELLMLDPPASYRQISQALPIPVGSIGPTRQRCLDRLRSLIDDPRPAR